VFQITNTQNAQDAKSQARIAFDADAGMGANALRALEASLSAFERHRQFVLKRQRATRR
jgi:hypothetical protein